MRKTKIRSHTRRHKQIERLRLDYVSLDLADYLLNVRNRLYTKITVHPWSGLSLTHSVPRQPRGKTKQLILSGLLDIYDSWKHQLDTLGQPYYLKLWLFEPRFSQSQVVCAIGDSLGFYENTFFKPEVGKTINFEGYGHLKERLLALDWEYRLDEDHYDNTFVGEPEHYANTQEYEESRRWFERLLKKPHRTHTFEEPIGEITELYSFRRGDVWLGGART